MFEGPSSSTARRPVQGDPPNLQMRRGDPALSGPHGPQHHGAIAQVAACLGSLRVATSMGAGRPRQGRKAASQPRPASRKTLVRGRRLDPGRHRRNPHRHAAWLCRRSCGARSPLPTSSRMHEHGAARMPEREAMALRLDGDALDRGRHAGSGQRLPTPEGSQPSFQRCAPLWKLTTTKTHTASLLTKPSPCAAARF